MSNFEILIRGTKTIVRTGSIADVAAYLKPGYPDVRLVKRGYATWQIRSGGLTHGSVQEL